MSISMFATIKVACVGDSITFGYGIKNRSIQSYPNQLNKMLGPKYKVRNFGVCARTLLKDGDFPYTHTSQYTASLKWNPDLVIIKLGTNDTKLINWKYKTKFEEELSDLANSYLSLESKPKVYLSYPAPAFCIGNTIDGQRVLDEVIPHIKRVAKKLSLPIIDFHTLLFKDVKLFPDHVHPNAEGAFKLAKQVYEVMTNKRYKETYQSNNK